MNWNSTKGIILSNFRVCLPYKVFVIDIVESCDWELDTLLSELSALESQLNSSAGGDQLLLGLPMLPVPTSKNNSTNLSQRNSTLSTSTSTQHTHSDTHKRLVASFKKICIYFVEILSYIISLWKIDGRLLNSENSPNIDQGVYSLATDIWAMNVSIITETCGKKISLTHINNLVFFFDFLSNIVLCVVAAICSK